MIIDHYGWAYNMQARGLQKYSKHEIIIKACNDVTQKDIDKADIVHVWSWTNLPTIYGRRLSFGNRKIISGSWSTVFPEDVYKKYMGPNYPPPSLNNVESMIISDRRVYNKVITENIKPNIKFYFSPHQVDTDIFCPISIKHKGYVLGWVGDAKRPDKRAKLLDKLKYPIKVRSTNIERYFVKDRSLEEIRDFYHSLDVYIFVSNAAVEGGISLTILEAMACGLPVISTNHGSELKNVLGSKWIIPCQPEEQVIKLMNEKLELLEKNPKLRKKIGRRNRKKALEFSWKKIAKQYDRVYNQFGLKYTQLKDVNIQQFLNEVKDKFISDPKDETLYILGEWNIKDGNLVLDTKWKRYGYACLDKNQVVGILYFRWLSPDFGFGNKCAYIAGVVKEGYRGRGIGTSLYRLTESLAREMDAERVFSANRHDLNAKSFTALTNIILKAGFKEIDSYPIISEPKGLILKKSNIWNKRKCIQKRFMKELK